MSLRVLARPGGQPGILHVCSPRVNRGKYAMATRRHDTGPPEDAIEMLRADHQKVRELFQDYEAAQDQRAKRKIAQQIFVELETHAQLEESV
jgi:hypothetical protein